MLRACRQGAEAIDDLGGELIKGGLVGCGGDAFVERQAHVHIGDVGVGDEGGQAQLDFGVRGERPVEGWFTPVLQSFHRLLEHVEVERKDVYKRQV